MPPLPLILSNTATQDTGEKRPVVLCIGGLDPSGGAGLPADARAVQAFGGHPCQIATAVIAQNTRGVAAFEAVSNDMLRRQFENLLEDITPQAVKIGMLPTPEGVAIVADYVKGASIPIVVDTVFAPSSGPRFSGDETVAAIRSRLLPHAELATPNLPEAERLCGFSIHTSIDAESAARLIVERDGVRNVLLKGGHAVGEESAAEAIDLFFDGRNSHRFSAPRIGGYEVRGTGCMLASAIATGLACGVPLVEAIPAAKLWLHERIQNAIVIGHGRRIAL